MKCEICKTIEKLDLNPEAHDLWVCSDAWSPRITLRKARISIHYFCHEVGTSIAAKWRQGGCMLHQRAHYVTLGL
jgi:hypothetical protein